MRYPLLEGAPSPLVGSRRLERAKQALGDPVVARIVGFALHVLGWTQRGAAESVGFTVPGLKSLVKEVLGQGVSRFVDGRRRGAWEAAPARPSTVEAPPEVSVEETDGRIKIRLGGWTLQVPCNDALGRKVLAMILIDSGVLTQRAAAPVMDTQPLAVMKNYQKYRAEGALGLVDKRVGQRRDYRFTPEVKGELCYGYSMQALQGRKPSSPALAAHLDEVLGQRFSPRTVSEHIRKMGLSLVGPRLVTDMRAVLDEWTQKKGGLNT